MHGFARFCAEKMLLVQGLRKCRPWTNSFGTVLRGKMLFLQGLRKCRPCKNSSFCTVLGYKMLLVLSVYRYTD